MIIKALFKTAVIGVLVVAGITYAMYLKTGRFVMPIHWSKPDISMPKITKSTLPDWVVEKNKVAYKWRDQSGHWQYTTEPPQGNIAYEKIEALPATK